MLRLDIKKKMNRKKDKENSRKKAKKESKTEEAMKSTYENIISLPNHLIPSDNCIEIVF
jgi:hypothetical protein